MIAVRPQTLVNGIVADSLAVTDRGLLYGDGLFETLAVRNGLPQRWGRHLARLQGGCKRLSIALPDGSLLAAEAARLCAGVDRAVLKILITRGTGSRGYRPDAVAVPTRIVQCLPDPGYSPDLARDGIVARLCALRLGHNSALAGLKHLNRLEQVLARSEWNDDNIREGLLTDQTGNLVEGIMSNVFLVHGDTLLTPDLARCGVSGIMRGLVLELAAHAGIACAVRDVALDEIWQADELFVCNSLAGIWPVVKCDNHTYAIGRVTRTLQRLLEELPDDE
jgi:4-amino-4-deoxychorismate lyase